MKKAVYLLVIVFATAVGVSQASPAQCPLCVSEGCWANFGTNCVGWEDVPQCTQEQKNRCTNWYP